MRRAALAGVLALACGHGGLGPHAPAADVRDDALAYIPLDAELVVVADVARARSSALWRRIDRAFGQALGDARTQYQQRCGYDPLAVSSVTAAMWSLRTSPISMVVVARGVDATKLESCLQGVLGEKVRREGDTWHVEVPFAGEMQVAAIGSTVIAYIGADASAQRIAELLKAGAPLRHSNGFAKLAAELPDDAALWAMARTTPWSEVQSFSAAVTVDDGMTVVAHGTVIDPQDAEKFRSWALQEANKVAEKIDVSIKGTTVYFRGRMTGTQIEASLKHPQAWW